MTGGILVLALGLLLLIWLFFGPRGSSVTVTKRYSSGVSNISYPYQASESRKAILVSKFHEIKTGMSEEEVVAILSQPDEIHPVYEPIVFRPSQVGFTYWYYFQKPHGNSSRDIQAIRILFDASEKTLNIDLLGMDLIKQD